MTIAFIHFLANLIIALALLRVAEVTLIRLYGEENSLAKAMAFLH